MSEKFGSAARETSRFSTGLWQPGTSFPGVDNKLGVDARDRSHIFGEGSHNSSIRAIDPEAFGSGDIMGSLDAPCDKLSLLVEIANQTRDDAINSMVDAMNGN